MYTNLPKLSFYVKSFDFSVCSNYKQYFNGESHLYFWSWVIKKKILDVHLLAQRLMQCSFVKYCQVLLPNRNCSLYLLQHGLNVCCSQTLLWNCHVIFFYFAKLIGMIEYFNNVLSFSFFNTNMVGVLFLFLKSVWFLSYGLILVFTHYYIVHLIITASNLFDLFDIFMIYLNLVILILGYFIRFLNCSYYVLFWRENIGHFNHLSYLDILNTLMFTCLFII